MIKNIFKNFVSGSATRPYPIEIRPGFKDARGELGNKVSACNLCGICAKKCPSQCITVSRKTGVWEVDPYSCVYCGICVEACPKNCLFHYTEHRKPARKKEALTLTKNDSPKVKVRKETVCEKTA
ncbi:MAG: 4Fe-4S binding protein [Desulfobacterales bacterium]|nr:4Fe-4S binding protein [Desulfobacterales bacterium]